MHLSFLLSASSTYVSQSSSEVKITHLSVHAYTGKEIIQSVLLAVSPFIIVLVLGTQSICVLCFDDGVMVQKR